MYKKTTCQFQIKFITEDYLQMYKTVQLFTNTFSFNTNNFSSIKVIKTHMCRQKVFKDGKFIKTRVKLNTVQCSWLNEITLTCTDVFIVLFFS